MSIDQWDCSGSVFGIKGKEKEFYSGYFKICRKKFQILKYDGGEDEDDSDSDEELSRHGSTRSTKSSIFIQLIFYGV